MSETELQPVKFYRGACVQAHYYAYLAASGVERGRTGLGQGGGEVSRGIQLEMGGSRGMWRG